MLTRHLFFVLVGHKYPTKTGASQTCSINQQSLCSNRQISELCVLMIFLQNCSLTFDCDCVLARLNTII